MWKACRLKKWPNSSIARKPQCVPTSPTDARNFAGTWKKGSGRNMRHPNQASLALHAGGDLGPFARWRTSRHLARCESCREEVAAFDEVRRSLPGMAEVPDLQWNRLAAEIKANVRLGLAAGACGRAAQRPLRGSP